MYCAKFNLGYPPPERIEVDYRVSHDMCDQDGCTTLLVWYEHGQEDAVGGFGATCRVCKESGVCCGSHVKDYICTECEADHKRQKK